MIRETACGGLTERKCDHPDALHQRRRSSSDQVFDNFAVNVCESEVTARISTGQLLVVES
jgi:hypothetical protein